ncbi:MAG: DUF6731 family protein [Pseudomonadota bacterium]
MDRLVKARFYQISNIDNAQRTFFDCMHYLWDHPDRSAYDDVSGGLRVRLERWAASAGNDGTWNGEFVRQQTENIPPRALDDGPLEPLSDPQGHRAAFRYWPSHKTLVLETRRGAVSAAAVQKLVRKRVPQHRGFLIDPMLSEGAIEQLTDGTPRRIEMKVARPADMAAFEGAQNPIEENLSNLQQYHGGPNVEYAVSWGRSNRDESLIKDRIMNLLPWIDRNRHAIKKVKIKIEEQSEALDILTELMLEKETLQLDSENVNLHYDERQAFLARALSNRRDEIRRVYGDG